MSTLHRALGAPTLCLLLSAPVAAQSVVIQGSSQVVKGFIAELKSTVGLSSPDELASLGARHPDMKWRTEQMAANAGVLERKQLAQQWKDNQRRKPPPALFVKRPLPDGTAVPKPSFP